MLQKVQTDMCAGASGADSTCAVRMSHVTKIFTQWQRENTGKSIIKNLIRPEKRIITALDDISFTICKGEFVAYAGPNGAGKSTTMKLLCGMLMANSGEIRVLSKSPQKDRIGLMNKVGVLFGNRSELWWDHPIIQSFEWKKVVWNIPDEVYSSNLTMVKELLGIDPLMKTFARELSLGQRMRADLALMLLHSPELILLDEPTLGLDVVAKRQMIDFLKHLNAEKGATIIVTSHDMDDLEEMAQRIIMVANGKVAFDGNFDGLRQIAGNLSKVTVTSKSNAVPQIQHGTLIQSNNGVFEFEIDLNKTPINLILSELAEILDIQDVEIGKAPIEQVIAEIYKMWNTSNRKQFSV